MENATNLEILILEGCINLLKLPSSMGNLKELYLRNCSSLVQLPSSVRNSLNLKRFSFKGCSSLVELPSSLGNATPQNKFSLSGCSSLLELPSSIGNMTTLEKLSLRRCSSLVELPSSIGNLHNLHSLFLQGCSKLKTLPVNINMKSLDKLVLTDCSSLKRFPEISTNIRNIELIGTGIEEIPSSIRSWSRLDDLLISYCANLRKSQHAFDRITVLHLSDTRIQEISPWVKETSIYTLIISGCTKLVSLPKLPDSLAVINAENCESLERLDGSFGKTTFDTITFANCFKLNQETRDLIIKASTISLAVLPGDNVPRYFTYRATGSSLSIKSDGFDTRLRFKGCILLVKKDDVEADYWHSPTVRYHIKDKLRGDLVDFNECSSCLRHSPPSKEHLVVFEFDINVSFAQVVVEFGFNDEKWEIEECGLRPLETLPPLPFIHF